MSQKQDVSQESSSRPMLGLTLGGGGARGLAHIGVLKVFEREGIPVDFLAGTSMGGIIAAAYAAGLTADDLREEAATITRFINMIRLMDPGLPRNGILRGKRLHRYIERRLGPLSFRQLKCPLALIAVDLNSRREVVLREGSLATAVRATIAVPGLFTPVESGGCRMVDGGLLNNLPVDAARALGADVVVAVDIQPCLNRDFEGGFSGTRWIPAGLAQTLSTLDEALSVLLARAQEINLQQHPPEVLIRPEFLRHANAIIGYGRVDELVAAGELAAEVALPTLQHLMAS
ncbi:MAG: patatin-like phospholipase family protein [Anaerolineales bacterium]